MPAVIECPKTEVLERLLLGQIAAEEASSLESHVLSCPGCGQAFRSIRAVDGLVAAVKEAGTQPLVAAEAAEALIPWLKRLRPKDPTQTVATAAPGTEPKAIVLPTYDFLSAPVEADELGRLGNYRVLQPLGVGGMGIVFLAADPRLKRHVALKLIKPELLQRRDLHERFLSEARAIAAVEHDNIVAIYEADEISGVPYLVMPFLQGESLEDCLKRHEGPLPVDEILRIGREIAVGLAAAHGRGLVHRDIKPSNVWLEAGAQEAEIDKPLDKRGAARSLGRVKILDFGLARPVEGLAEERNPHAILGTPAYMSPEQGRGLALDARADLFSLGCVVYRMATGRVPFQGKDVLTTLLSVATDTPVPPRLLNPKLPADLTALIENLLAKKADERVSSASGVVEALRKIERKRQPRALGRWLALTAAGITLAILATLAVAHRLHQPLRPVEVTLEYQEPDAVLVLRGDDGAEEEIDVAKTPKRLWKPGAYVLRPKVALPNRSLWPASFVVEPNKPMALSLRLVGLIRTYDGHSQGVNAVAFLPDGSTLALSGSNDFDLRLWDTAKEGAGIRLLGHESPVRCLAIAPDGKTALTGSGKAHTRDPDIHVRVWDVKNRTAVAMLNGHESSVTAVAFDPQAEFFLSGDMDGVVTFWDAKKRQALQSIEAHLGTAVHGLAFLPGGKKALSCGGDGKVLLWNVESRHIEKTLHRHAESATGISAAPDGTHAATSSNDGTICVWSLPTGECRTLRGHEHEVHCVAYSTDGKRLLSGGRDKTVRLWNAESGELIHVFYGHHHAVHCVAFAADGQRALSGGADGVVCLWELPK